MAIFRRRLLSGWAFVQMCRCADVQMCRCADVQIIKTGRPACGGRALRGFAPEPLCVSAVRLQSMAQGAGSRGSAWLHAHPQRLQRIPRDPAHACGLRRYRAPGATAAPLFISAGLRPASGAPARGFIAVIDCLCHFSSPLSSLRHCYSSLPLARAARARFS